MNSYLLSKYTVIACQMMVERLHAVFEEIVQYIYTWEKFPYGATTFSFDMK